MTVMTVMMQVHGAVWKTSRNTSDWMRLRECLRMIWGFLDKGKVNKASQHPGRKEEIYYESLNMEMAHFSTHIHI